MTENFSPDRRFMIEAIANAMAAIPRGEGGPFGACIVRDGQIVACEHNTVLRHRDATCHAEVNAIRAASQALDRYELSDCVIYSTTEPCPMCFSAIHWARIPLLVFGTRIADVRALGFNELELSNAQMRELGRSPVRLFGDFMRDDCLALLQRWKADAGEIY
jgi:tRNA(Arg) A34 adenosine deaminase TadA